MISKTFYAPLVIKREKSERKTTIKMSICVKYFTQMKKVLGCIALKKIKSKNYKSYELLRATTKLSLAELMENNNLHSTLS